MGEITEKGKVWRGVGRVKNPVVGYTDVQGGFDPSKTKFGELKRLFN
jgi:hypothetical protein